MNMFKICIIGCGGISQIAHGPALKKYQNDNPGIELTACCDIDEAKAKSFQEEFDFRRYYSDFRQMLDKEKPDAVSLIVPPALTKEMAVEILMQGYPLLLEKPPGLSVIEVQEIDRAAQKTSTANSVAFNRRYMPMISSLKSELSKIKQGSQIQNIKYDLNRVGRRDSDFATTAIHGIDTVRFIVESDYEHINFTYQFLDGSSSICNIFMDCLFENGVIAQLSFCPLSGVVTERSIITSESKSIFLELPIGNGTDIPGSLKVYDKGELVLTQTGNECCPNGEMFVTNGFYTENETFFDAIRKGETPPCSVKSAYQTVEIADCIRKRSKTYDK